MKSRYCVITALALWLFSSVSFASIQNWTGHSDGDEQEIIFDSDDKSDKKKSLTITFNGDWDSNPAEIWLKIVTGGRKGGGHHGGGWHDDWDDHHGNWDGHHPKCDPPANVPVPSAIWLFGSALMGLFGIKRKFTV